MLRTTNTFCPRGHALKQFRRNYSGQSRQDITGTQKYRALKATCQVCLAGCLTRMRRPSWYGMRDVAQRKRKTDLKYRATNGRKVEMLFAHLKDPESDTARTGFRMGQRMNSL
jgi:hypothetical protein